MITDLAEFAKEQFKAAQSPSACLLSAERLRDAAEAILKQEVEAEIPYFQARSKAEKEAIGEAYSEGKDEGSAEIKATPIVLDSLSESQRAHGFHG